MGVESHATHPIAAHKHQVRTKLSQKASFHRDGTYLCPVNVDWSSPDDAFQILTVLSRLPLAICLPSELKQTLATGLLLKNTKSVPIYKRRHSIQGDGTYLCPFRGEPMGSPVVASHTLTVLSELPETSFLPLGSNPTLQTVLRIAG